ncbi:hypothetical protein PSm6_44280 [Pseudomonas solani]|uniref:Uncharacterized protein n=1 Tax=Pseudomonas solani TaxID=2731552 RepID=A0ABM7LEN4_9PSED|nr:hypothetical protein [Pseudomonas solani]BCD88021.1 hypothetical protein PSm6_44280 [Pseudomonas solani]
MSEYDPKGRYDLITGTGEKIAEVVKGVLYEVAPDYRQPAGELTAVARIDGLTAIRSDGAVFQLVPQA